MRGTGIARFVGLTMAGGALAVAAPASVAAEPVAESSIEVVSLGDGRGCDAYGAFAPVIRYTATNSSDLGGSFFVTIEGGGVSEPWLARTFVEAGGSVNGELASQPLRAGEQVLSVRSGAEVLASVTIDVPACPPGSRSPCPRRLPR